MTGISPHYRDDEIEGLPIAVKDYVDAHYLKNLKNFDRTNPKLLIVFAGGNAVGKSTLSQRISDECGAVVLENDAMKMCIRELMPDISRDDLNVLTWKYSMDLYARLDEITNNGLIVRDGVIHWYFDRILPVFLHRGYELFIVGYDLSKEKQTQLIKNRGDKPTITVERFMTLMEDHAIHHKRFLEHYAADITLTDDTVFDHDSVIRKLHERLNALSTESRG